MRILQELVDQPLPSRVPSAHCFLPVWGCLCSPFWSCSKTDTQYFWFFFYIYFFKYSLPSTPESVAVQHGEQQLLRVLNTASDWAQKNLIVSFNILVMSFKHYWKTFRKLLLWGKLATDRSGVLIACSPLWIQEGAYNLSTGLEVTGGKGLICSVTKAFWSKMSN